MNFIKFSVGNTNVFPMANSSAGGQLLSEFNIRSRESVGTPQSIKYMIGPSYTHSQDDFSISFEQDSTGTTLSKQSIQISEGRALVNGHFVESLTPVIIDLVAANAQIQKDNKKLPADQKVSMLNGDLTIGLRTMYSTEYTTSGSLLIEDKDGMFAGVQVVILPTDEFKTPIDVPEDPNKVTAHLKLGTFHFVNNIISNIEQNPDKAQILTADRIGDVGGYFSGVYVSKTGLSPRHHYVYTTKNNSAEQNADTWCQADDALMIWDRNPSLTTTSPAHDAEAKFVYDNITGKTSLVLPHKQPDGLVNTSGEQQYFLDKILNLPTANYDKGTGGVVDKNYTKNVKRVMEKINQFYILPTGGMKYYLPELSDKNELPKLSTQVNWQPGDYVLVGRDNTYDDLADTETAPATLYVIIPGKIRRLEYVDEIQSHLISYTDSNAWKDLILTIIKSIDWRKEVKDALDTHGTLTNIDWNDVLHNRIYGLNFLSSIDWETIITNEIAKHQDTDNISWDAAITQMWETAESNYKARQEEALAAATQRLENATAEKENADQALENAETARNSAQQAVNVAHDNVETRRTQLDNATYDLDVIYYWVSRIRAAQGTGDIGSITVDTRRLSDGKKFEDVFTVITEAKITSVTNEYDGKRQTASTNYTNAQHALSTAEAALQEKENKVTEARDNVTVAQTNIDEAQLSVNTLTAVVGSEGEPGLIDELFSNGDHFPVENLANKIAASFEEGGIDWTKLILRELSNGIAYTSEVDWNELIYETVENHQDITQVNWADVITNAVMQYIVRNDSIETLMDSQVPASLTNGIELGREQIDFSDIDEYKSNIDKVHELFGINPSDMSDQDYPRGRVRTDYYRLIYTDDDNNIYHLFYTVADTSDKEYCDPPVRVTGGVPYAQEDVIGGFLNVPESQLGAGYVYRNDEGYLQLLDYDLLASGVLAYQLGEDFSIPAGLSSTEIQANLDEYVNARIAFPNSNQLANSSTPYVIHININLSSEDTGYELSLNNIDSRFNTVVYVHVTGEADSSCILNIIKCEKLRLDLNVTGGLTVNLVDTNLYYDADVLDKIEHISGLSLWYQKFNTDDPDIFVEGMSVEYTGEPEAISNEDYWNVDSPNDNHYLYALKGLTFNQSGKIVGVKLLVTDDITGNVEEGKFLSTFEFSFPQSSGLSYPASKLSKSIKVSGTFITAYPMSADVGYLIKDNSFTAMTYDTSNQTALSGLISFRTDIYYVKRIFGIGNEMTGAAQLPNVDTWTPGEFHIFEGGTID